jgi:hypothetical protein
MGKNKSTKSDGVENFTNTQDLGDKKRIPRGAIPTGNYNAHKK